MNSPDFIVPPPGLIPDAAQVPVPVTPRPLLPSAPPRPAAVPAWRLRSAHGTEVRVVGATVLGRDPVIDPASGHVAVALADPARSVSKTHALVQVASGRLIVTDLRSTNGVRVWPEGGEPADILPDVPTEVPHGATLLLGDLGFLAERVPGGAVVA